MFRHTKIFYDHTLDYGKIARAVYGTNKCLVVAEKIQTNAHVHFQGITDFSERVYVDKFSEATADHYMRKQKSTSRPIRHVRTGEINEQGFQYMCKESPPTVLYKQELTDEDIIALHEASEEHVDELKHGLKRKLHEIDTSSDSPSEVHAKYREHGLDYYIDQDKMPPPNFQKHILWAMASKKPPHHAWKLYVAERI